MALNVARKDLDEIFAGIGKETAPQWPLSKMESMVANLPTLMDDKAEQFEELPERLQEVVNSIKEALDEGSDVTVVDGESSDEDEKPAKKKKKGEDEVEKKPKKAKVKAAKEEEKPAKKKKKKASPVASNGTNFARAASGPGKPGIMASMMEFLENASQDAPVTRDQIVKKLVKRFPNRDERGMHVTVFSQIPTRYLKRGINLKGDRENGFWISKKKKKVKVEEE